MEGRSHAFPAKRGREAALSNKRKRILLFNLITSRWEDCAFHFASRISHDVGGADDDGDDDDDDGDDE